MQFGRSTQSLQLHFLFNFFQQENNAKQTPTHYVKILPSQVLHIKCPVESVPKFGTLFLIP